MVQTERKWSKNTGFIACRFQMHSKCTSPPLEMKRHAGAFSLETIDEFTYMHRIANDWLVYCKVMIPGND